MCVVNYSERLRGLFRSVFHFLCAGPFTRTANQNDLSHRQVTTDSKCWISQKASDKHKAILMLMFTPNWPEPPTVSDSPDKSQSPTAGRQCEAQMMLLYVDDYYVKTPPKILLQTTHLHWEWNTMQDGCMVKHNRMQTESLHRCLCPVLWFWGQLPAASSLFCLQLSGSKPAA